MQLVKSYKHPDIRAGLRSLFPDQTGGPANRHIHGKVAISKNGTYFVTAERAGWRGRKYVVRKISNEDGYLTAKPLFETAWGHIAMDKMVELAVA